LIERYGFQCLQDNSRDTYYGLFFIPEFLHIARATSVEVKISDLHPMKQLGVLMSVHMVFGACLGNQGSVKHIKVYNS
jgi:hypothetical protein